MHKQKICKPDMAFLFFCYILRHANKIAKTFLMRACLTKNGNLDFGEIPSEIAKVIRRQEGKIRLRIGVEIDNEIGKKPLLWECQSERS